MSIEAMKFGGCPFCGSQSCVAGQCQSQAIAEAEQDEPVAYDVRCDNCGGDGFDPKDNNYKCVSCEGSGFLEKLLYTHPQPRKPLTDDQWQVIADTLDCLITRSQKDVIEAALDIKE